MPGNHLGAPATGNGIVIKNYVIKLFNEDEPNMPDDKSVDSEDGFINVASCDANAKKPAALSTSRTRH